MGTGLLDYDFVASSPSLAAGRPRIIFFRLLLDILEKRDPSIFNGLETQKPF
jgi:hypothetical protein